MHDAFLMFGLLSAVVALVIAARRTHIPYPVLLVIGGLALGFVPGLPRVRMNPDLVLLLFLPPLLYPTAMHLSLRDFQANMRPIGILAVGLVISTAAVVAAVAHAAIPGLSWAAAFTFGAVVAPTDAVAAEAIGRRLALPRRVMTIIQGESLMNDATALVLFRLALIAVATGVFSPWAAAGQLIWSIAGGIGIGFVVGYGVGWLRKILTEEPAVENTISLLTPFAAYLPADHFGASGVLAVVTAGLFLGWHSPKIVSSSTRLHASAIWDMVEFLLNGVLFLLTGLQMRTIWDNLGSHAAGGLLRQAALMTFTVIAVRIVCVFASAYLPNLLGRHAPPKRRLTTIVAWTGMRGGVSLAAALTIPYHAFPQRDLLIFLAFSVIFVTLVLQGLTLPVLIARLGIEEDGEAAKEETKARAAVSNAALKHIDQIIADPNTPSGVAEQVRELFAQRAHRYSAERDGTLDDAEQERIDTFLRLRRESVDIERQEVIALRDRGEISDDVLRTIQRDLDLEEERLPSDEE